MSIDDITPEEWDALREAFEEDRVLPAPTLVTLMEMGADIPEEFEDVYDVMLPGAEKHGKDTWLDKDNPSLEHRANHASMSRHLAEGYMGRTADPETGLHPYLHLACRALMAYTRYKRGIDKHEDK
jgi:hypothetical protein